MVKMFPLYNEDVLSRTKEGRALLLISLLFILIRLLYLQQYEHNNPFYNHPVLDSAFYLQWADTIRSGSQFFREEYHHPPGYAFFLAALLSVSAGNLYAVLLAQSLMLSLQGFLVFSTTKRLAGSTAAWVAFALFCLCGPLVFYSMKLLSETLFSTLLLLGFYLLIRFTQEKRQGDLFLSGLSLGAAIEVRGTAMIYVLPALIALWFITKEWRVRAKSALIFAVGVAVFVLPVLIRNVVVSGHWIPVASNWGENFYMANNPQAAGSFSSIPGVRPNLVDQIQDIKAEASRRSGRSLSSIEAQQFWFAEGLRFISNEPDAWLALLGRKVQRIFSRQEVSTMYFYDLESQHFQPSLKLLFLNAAWILPLFFIGTVFSPSSPGTRMLFGFLFAHLFLLLVFWPELRFLVPVIPLMLIVSGFIGRIHIEKWHAAVAAFGLLLCILLNWKPIPGTGGREAWYTNASSAYYANEQMDAAIAMAQSAIKLNPNYADAWVNLGAALYAKGQKQEARNAWSFALKLQPGHPVALRNLEQTNHQGTKTQR